MPKQAIGWIKTKSFYQESIRVSTPDPRDATSSHSLYLSNLQTPATKLSSKQADRQHQCYRSHVCWKTYT